MQPIRYPTIQKVKRANNKFVYAIRYYKDGKRAQKSAGARYDIAVKIASSIYSDLVAEASGEKRLVDAPSLESLIDQFITSKIRRTSKSTQSRYRIYATHLLEFFKDNFPRIKGIDQITRAQLHEHILALEQEGKANKTLNGQIQFVRSLFILALEEEYIAISPAAKLKAYPERKDERPPFWTEDEVVRILETSKAAWRDMYEFLYHTGLRKGELIHLKWGDVHLNVKLPSISINADKGHTTKTNKSRSVPLNQFAIEILKRQKPGDRSSFVFRGPGGGKVHPDRIYTALKRALKKLGLTGDVHQFRHTFASHLVMKAVGIEVVSKLLGHTTIEMTMRYAHLAPDYLLTAVEKLELPVLCK
jgi:integrase